MSKSIAVIGGGIVGLCCAYYLAKKGAKVSVFDKSDLTDGCSYGNAGMIVPSHIIPLAQPGMIQKGIQWMFNSKSPFYIKPAVNKNLLIWMYQFLKNSTQKHVNQSMVPLRDLSLFSKELFRELAKENKSFLYDEKGLLMLYKTEKMGEEEVAAGEIAKNLGIEVDFLDKVGINKLEKNITINALGAVHYKSDAHLSPQKFMNFLKAELLKMNVELHSNTIVNDFKISNQKINQIQTNKGDFFADEVVIATGSWSTQMSKKLGLNLLILPGKGYSFIKENLSQTITVPSILCEGKVAVTPFGNAVRFGGTLEITNTNDTAIHKNRLQGIVEKVNEFYPEIKVEMPETNVVWSGFRPCTPNGLPVIERSSKFKNVIIATGHAMMGVSLAPATGKLVSELAFFEEPSVSIEKFKS